jgi:hypothetical protein
MVGPTLPYLPHRGVSLVFSAVVKYKVVKIVRFSSDVIL